MEKFESMKSNGGSISNFEFRNSNFFPGGTDCSMPLVAANQKHAKRKFAGIVLFSDNESWVGMRRHGSIRAFLADNNQRFVAEVEAIDPFLKTGDYHPFVARSKTKADRLHHLSTYRKLSPCLEEYVDADDWIPF